MLPLFVKLYEVGLAGVIQLNRSEVHNSIYWEMIERVLQLLKGWQHKKGVVILKVLDKIFPFEGHVEKLLSLPPAAVISGLKIGYRCIDLISNYKIPYVPFIDEISIGSCVYYSLTGKYSVATEKTSFSIPETEMGYLNYAGLTFLLSRLKNNLGFYIGMTGARINGFDVKKIGLATHYVESYKLNDLEIVLTKCKSDEQVNKVLQGFSSNPSLPDTELDVLLPKIKTCFSGESLENIYENLKADGSDWAQNTLKKLIKMSPIGLKVVHRSLQIGGTLSLRDCLRMEFRIVIHHINKTNMEEDATITDDDIKSKWNRKSIYNVTRDDVLRFFQPLPSGDDLTFESNEEGIPSKL